VVEVVNEKKQVFSAAIFPPFCFLSQRLITNVSVIYQMEGIFVLYNIGLTLIYRKLKSSGVKSVNIYFSIHDTEVILAAILLPCKVFNSCDILFERYFCALQHWSNIVIWKNGWKR
jgi:hypothetical protein